MTELKPVIEESMVQYAGAVLQSRALVDVRDALKPSARQILYCMDMCKYTSDKPIQPTAASLGDALKYFYIHGDTSCLGIIMRAGQPFAMRYPLVEVGGNGGTLMKAGNWAAYRYTKARLSKVSNCLFEDIDKDTIDEWRDNFSDTKQYPAVLPTKGFYNIVNGTSGIGIGMASSIPQYNIRELNNALIHLIDHPDCSFEEIYCAPDFATGAILYNENEVKQSMKNGTGFACKLRSVVEFDQKDRCFVVTEIPYGVYTETITGQLEEIINGDENPGIDRFNDLTGKGTHSLIKIYLEKKANPDKVLRYLFKNTSLQSHFGINFTMLDMGRFPKVFTWKEMLQAHIDHEKVVYRRGFEHDLKKKEDRIHILDGLLICLAHIEEVIQTIKASASTAAASMELQKKFLLDEVQAKAVLDMKLSRLANMEVKKLEEEHEKLLKEINRLKEILNNEELFNEELKNGWREVAKKFGDERRTKIITLAEGNDSEPIERKQLSISFTNNGAIFVSETSTLYSQKRNGAGAKFKLDEGEYIVDNLVGENTDTILFFTSHGNFYHSKMGEFVVNEKQYLSNFINIQPFEKVVAAAVTSKQNAKEYIIFITKNGILKKSALSEYNLKRNVGATAIKLDKGDEIVSVLFLNKEKIGIASRAGQFIMITTTDINTIGRTTRGVSGMKLNDGDTVVGAIIINDATKELVTVAEDGYIKRSALSEFRITGRATKGVRIQNTDCLCSILSVSENQDVLVNSSKAQIRLKLSDIPLLSRGTQGVKSIKLSENSKVLKLSGI